MQKYYKRDRKNSEEAKWEELVSLKDLWGRSSKQVGVLSIVIRQDATTHNKGRDLSAGTIFPFTVNICSLDKQWGQEIYKQCSEQLSL